MNRAEFANAVAAHVAKVILDKARASINEQAENGNLLKLSEPERDLAAAELTEMVIEEGTKMVRTVIDDAMVGIALSDVPDGEQKETMRNVLTLLMVQNLSYRETADKLGLSAEEVERLHDKARETWKAAGLFDKEGSP